MPCFVSHVCQKGHAASFQAGTPVASFCAECGLPVFDACPICKTQFLFQDETWDGVLGRPPVHRPKYCTHCGEPMPWTKAALSGIEEMLKEEKKLSPKERAQITASLPDILADNPKTNVAVLLLKKALLKVGDLTAASLVDFVLKYGGELAKKLSGF